MSNPKQEEDEQWMRRAIQISELGFTPPNPRVGCVLVKDGVKVGEGYHTYAGQPHAEVVALTNAGELARGSTAYVSLEPCCHFGKTPPCTQALISAGVVRIVAAILDPNPKVSSRGLKELADAGIEVELGTLSAEAERANEAFLHFHRTGNPWVTLKYAMTLDGKIAASSGDSKWITGVEARAHVHDVRAQSAAIICGIGTVLADDPMLTARRDNPYPHQPARFVLDPSLRIPINSKLVQSAHDYPLTVVCAMATSECSRAELENLGVEVLPMELHRSGHFDLEILLEHMANKGLISLFVEGGSRTYSAFINSKRVNRVMAFIAPKIVGGSGAFSPVGDIGIGRMQSALELINIETGTFGNDFLISGLIKENAQI